MQDNLPDTATRDVDSSFETRVAIDVMFEALSHIQASIDASGEEERVETYRKFKEALYERYEHLLEKRRQEQMNGERYAPQVNGNGQVRDESTETDDESRGDEDTLGKLWPAVADKKNDQL